jgi:hypothetical protein
VVKAFGDNDRSVVVLTETTCTHPTFINNIYNHSFTVADYEFFADILMLLADDCIEKDKSFASTNKALAYRFYEPMTLLMR